MAEIQWQPSSLVWNWRAAPDAGDAREQAAAARRQGAIGGGVGLTVAAALAFLLHRTGLAAAVAAASLAVALLALAAPLTLYRRLRGALDRLGSWVGTAVTWLLMTVLFYLLFLPVGLILRATGKLSFTRFADPALETYWTTTTDRVPTAESYRKQF
ncbi:MAG TPA: hypothetical protein VHG32_19365 [Thermoanaerobaculia bacterium]|jgi:hypothetical protein|nr:hypothetical protein [Thermoanaerobaculia bacterium]